MLNAIGDLGIDKGREDLGTVDVSCDIQTKPVECHEEKEEEDSEAIVLFVEVPENSATIAASQLAVAIVPTSPKTIRHPVPHGR